MPGESGEGVPLPINPKAEADISEALANAGSEKLVSDHPPAAFTEQDEFIRKDSEPAESSTYKKGPWEHAEDTTPDGAWKFAAFWDEDGGPNLVDDAELKRREAFRKREAELREIIRKSNEQLHQENRKSQLSTKARNPENHTPSPATTKHQEWAAYKEALAPTIQNPQAAPEHKPLDARSRRDLLRGKSPKSH